MSDLSMAEYFLLGWSIVATLCAIYYQTRYAKVQSACKDVSILLCEVVVGDTKATKHGDIYELKGENGLHFRFKHKGVEADHVEVE